MDLKKESTVKKQELEMLGRRVSALIIVRELFVLLLSFIIMLSPYSGSIYNLILSLSGHALFCNFCDFVPQTVYMCKQPPLLF